MRIGICGNYGMSNVGDEAILKGLRLLCEGVFPDSEVTVFGKGMHFPFGIRSFLKSIFYPELWSKPYRALKQCDLFIIGGGGLFTEEESFFQPMYWSLQGLMAVVLGKRLVCLGISIGRLDWLNRLAVKALLNRARIITVRDNRSYKILDEWGIKSHLSSDLSLLLSPQVAPADTQKYVVINVRPFKNNDESLYKLVAQACDRMVADYGLLVYLIPFQQYGQNDSHILSKIVEQVKEKSKIIVHPFSEDIEGVVNILGGAEVVVGMRLHSGILSLLSGTPFIPLGYMEKVGNFWSEFDHVNTIDIGSISIDNLMETFQAVYNNRREHRQKNSLILQFLAGKAKLSQALLSSLYENIN